MIRSILIDKLYAIANRFDIKEVTKTILRKVLKSVIPIILYTNSKSLYNYQVKLGTT